MTKIIRKALAALMFVMIASIAAAVPSAVSAAEAGGGTAESLGAPGGVELGTQRYQNTRFGWSVTLSDNWLLYGKVKEFSDVEGSDRRGTVVFCHRELDDNYPNRCGQVMWIYAISKSKPGITKSNGYENRGGYLGESSSYYFFWEGPTDVRWLRPGHTSGPSDDLDRRYQSEYSVLTSAAESIRKTFTVSGSGDIHTEHVWNDGQILVSPTCTSAGKRRHYCLICSAYYDEAISALGHSYGSWTVTTKATCTTSGTKTRTCSRCGCKQSQTIAAPGHSYGSWVVTTKATCTTSGTKTKTCSRCGCKQSQTIAATGHSYGSWVVTKSATCTTAGTKTRTCSRCGGKQSQTIAAPGHSYGSWTVTKSATCTASGTQTRACSRCGGKQSQTIAAPGHSYGSWTVTKSATCTASGTQTRACSRCGGKQSKTIAARGHNFGSNYLCTRGCKTCDPSSVKTASTSRNTLRIQKDTVPAYGGPYSGCKVIATYKKGTNVTSVLTVKNGYGSTWYKLENGSYVPNSDVALHNSHKWDGGMVTKSPTCHSTGTRVRKCAVCGTTTTETIPKCAHKYNASSHLCVYGCKSFDPKSVTTVSTARVELRIANDTVYAYSGPYTGCKVAATYKRWTSVTAVAAVRNGYGSVWYKLDNGKYVSRADVVQK